MVRQLCQLAAAAVEIRYDTLDVTARVVGVHDPADDGHAVDTGAGEVLSVINSDIPDGDYGELGYFDEGGVALKAQGSAAGVLCRSVAERAGADVVEDVGEIVGGLDKLERAGGQTDDCVGAEEVAGYPRVKVVLADVDAGDTVGFEGEGDIDAVVDEHTSIRIDLVHGGGHRKAELVQVARANRFAARLDDSSTALGCSAGGLDDGVGFTGTGDEVAAEIQFLGHARHCIGQKVRYGLTIVIYWGERDAHMKIRALAAAALTALTLVAAPQVQAQTDPNYHWRTDPASKVLAGKPFADGVLHRVPGSWFDAQRANPGAAQAAARGRALYGAGAPIYVGLYGMCTVAAVGTDGAGRKVALTAGHCGNVGDQVVAADSFAAGPTGRVARKNGALDYAVIELGPRADLTASYNGTTIRSTGGAARTGDTLCKNGYATGVTCGMTWIADGVRNQSQVCAMAGDSGAPLYSGTRLVGMVNGSSIPQTANLACSTPLQGPIHAPTVSTNIDAIIRDLNARPGVGNGFRLAR